MPGRGVKLRPQSEAPLPFVPAQGQFSSIQTCSQASVIIFTHFCGGCSHWPCWKLWVSIQSEVRPLREQTQCPGHTTLVLWVGLSQPVRLPEQSTADGGLEPTQLYTSQSGGCKPEIRAPAGSVSGEPSSWFTHRCALCVLTWWRSRALSGSLLFLGAPPS